MEMEIDVSGSEDSSIDIEQDVSHATLNIDGLSLTLSFDQLENIYDELEKWYADDSFKDKYNELLMTVSSKQEGLTRHGVALNRLRLADEAEQQSACNAT